MTGEHLQSGDRVRIDPYHPILKVSRGHTATVVRLLASDFVVLEVDGIGIRCCTTEYLQPLPTAELLRERLEVA